MEAMTSGEKRKSYRRSTGEARMNARWRYPALFCAVVSICCCVSGVAQERSATHSDATPSRAAVVLDSMPHAKRIGEVALSPDGTQVAYIVDGKLAVIPAGGGASHAITVEGGLALRDVAWSADSKRIAFIADLLATFPLRKSGQRERTVGR